MMDRKPLLLALFPILMPVLAASAQSSPTDTQHRNTAMTSTRPAANEQSAGEVAPYQQVEGQISVIASRPIPAVKVRASRVDSSDASQGEIQPAGVASFQTAVGANPQSNASAVQSAPARKSSGTLAISQRPPIVQSQISVQSTGTSTSTGPTENQQFTTASSSCGNISLGVNGSLNGFIPSANDAWHQDISNAAVDPTSSTITLNNAADLAYRHLHPDFGSQSGIPYNVVDTSISGTQTQVQVAMTLYPGDSDQTYYPMQTGMAIEGYPGDCPTDGNDRHLIIIDRHSCANHEFWQAAPCQGSWSASNGLMFDLLTTEQRPYGMTSADVSGLSVLEGLVRYDEILAGSIQHAIRFTVPWSKNNQNEGYFVSPATHAGGTLWGTDNLMGMRIRLKASFDVSGFSPTNQIILNAMKKYGMILVDNGSGIYFQGTQDSRWDDDDLGNLTTISASSFDVITLPTRYDSSTAPTGAAPVISSFTATPTTSAGKTYYILKANISGATYSFMDQPGVNNGVIFRGFMAMQPTKTTTYTLTSRNLYGTTQAQVTVTVK